MKKYRHSIIYTILFFFFVAGCDSTKVTRINIDQKIDLSGAWNDYDAQLVSTEMIKDCLTRPWYGRFMGKNQKTPVVIVGHVYNRTSEHIDAHVFVTSLERELINSGQVDFVAAPDERLQVREERKNQQDGYSAKETIKKFGKEIGADYMLSGSISSIKDEVEGKAVIFYQVNLELIDLETNAKVWIGQTQIKKKVERSKFSL